MTHDYLYNLNDKHAFIANEISFNMHYFMIFLYVDIKFIKLFFFWKTLQRFQKRTNKELKFQLFTFFFIFTVLKIVQLRMIQ